MQNQSTCILLFVLFVLSLSSCNVTRYYMGRTTGKYEKLGMTTWQVENDSAITYWRRVGTGPANLLLLHGFGPATEMQWKEVVELLHTDFTMYIPDMIYFGESTSKYDSYDPQFITRQLYYALREQQLQEVYVAGLSFGGLITAIFAHHYPDITEGIILIDALSAFSERQPMDSLVKVHGYDRIEEIMIPADGRALKTLFEISYYKPKKYPLLTLNGPARTLYSNQRTQKEKLLHYLTTHDDEIRSYQFDYRGKVHIIWGKEDLILPLSNAYQLKDHYTSAGLTILPGVGHVANMERPKEVARIIRAMASE